MCVVQFIHGVLKWYVQLNGCVWGGFGNGVFGCMHVCECVQGCVRLEAWEQGVRSRCTIQLLPKSSARVMLNAYLEARVDANW